MKPSEFEITFLVVSYEKKTAGIMPIKLFGIMPRKLLSK